MEEPTLEVQADEEDFRVEMRRMQQEFRDEYSRDPETCMERGRLKILGLGYNSPL